MDPATVRERAETFCGALASGDMERATEHFSRELHANLGSAAPTGDTEAET